MLRMCCKRPTLHGLSRRTSWPLLLLVRGNPVNNDWEAEATCARWNPQHGWHNPLEAVMVETGYWSELSVDWRAWFGTLLHGL